MKDNVSYQKYQLLPKQDVVIFQETKSIENEQVDGNDEFQGQFYLNYVIVENL